MDLQNILKKKLQENDIFFIEDNCTTSVQLTTQIEARSKEVDAVCTNLCNYSSIASIAEITVPRKAFFSSAAIPLMVVPPGEHTASFSMPG